MDTLHIALDPALGISPQRFAAAWNADPSCRSLAQADVEPVPGVAFDPALAGAALVMLGALITGVAGNALYDVIKELLFKEGVTTRTRIEVYEQPDGSRLTVITRDEG